jgi:hypothetical protein
MFKICPKQILLAADMIEHHVTSRTSHLKKSEKCKLLKNTADRYDDVRKNAYEQIRFHECSKEAIAYKIPRYLS